MDGAKVEAVVAAVPEPTSKPLAMQMMDHQENETAYAGLEILKDIDGLYIKQEWEIFEQIASWYEQKNEYTIFDKNHKVQLFKANEKTSCCFRLCCGENRPFTIKVSDTTGEKKRTAMVLKRKYRCCGWAVIPCCAHRVDVHYMVDKNGNTIGSTSNQTRISTVNVPACHGGCCMPTWHIRDKKGAHQATISGGSCCVCDMCGKDFSVTDSNGKKMGELKKLAPKSFKEAAMELATEADNFRITFDKEIDPAIKLALLAATLQIDFTFFEDDRGPCQCRLFDCWCCGWAMPCLPVCFFTLCCFCCNHDDKEKKKAQARSGAPMAEEMER